MTHVFVCESFVASLKCFFASLEDSSEGNRVSLLEFTFIFCYKLQTFAIAKHLDFRIR